MLVPLSNHDALIVVDVQNDFLPGGSLGVPNGDQVIHPLNRCICAFLACQSLVVLTRDWHPINHCSFQPQGGPWPVHCIQGSEGAAPTGYAPGKAHQRPSHLS